jgi:hypothetical protein
LYIVVHPPIGYAGAAMAGATPGANFTERDRNRGEQHRSPAPEAIGAGDWFAPTEAALRRRNPRGKVPCSVAATAPARPPVAGRCVASLRRCTFYFDFRRNFRPMPQGAFLSSLAP